MVSNFIIQTKIEILSINYFLKNVPNAILSQQIRENLHVIDIINHNIENINFAQVFSVCC